MPTPGRPPTVGPSIRVFVPDSNQRRGARRPSGTASASCPDMGARILFRTVSQTQGGAAPAGRPVRQRCAECTVRSARVPVARHRRAGLAHGPSVAHGHCAARGQVSALARAEKAPTTQNNATRRAWPKIKVLQFSRHPMPARRPSDRADCEAQLGTGHRERARRLAGHWSTALPHGFPCVGPAFFGVLAPPVVATFVQPAAPHPPISGQ